MSLFVFGLGYSSLHFVRQHASSFGAIAGTVRSRDKADALKRQGINALVFDGETVPADLVARVGAAAALLVCVPPGADGDPIVRLFGQAIAAACDSAHIVYLSTVGVYGDHGGDWVDETTMPRPTSSRSLARLAAERAWRHLAQACGARLGVLRLAGIYGPRRNPLVNLREGTAKRVAKPDQVFNRIHVDDIGRAIAAAFTSGANGVWNVADDEPAPPQEVIAYAAELLQMPPPPEIAVDQAVLSPMARSFYNENKRVSNVRLKGDLGVRLAYPTYREGIRALFEAGEGR